MLSIHARLALRRYLQLGESRGVARGIADGMVIGCRGYLRVYRRVYLVGGMLYRDISVQPYSSSIPSSAKTTQPIA
jgi:hypothetical protein